MPEGTAFRLFFMTTRTVCSDRDCRGEPEERGSSRGRRRMRSTLTGSWQVLRWDAI